MHGVSRRVFLKTGTAAVVAAGAISAVPGLPALADVAESQGPADASALGSGEPLIAHVRDLASGEIGLFSGTREVTVLDPKLAALLARALK
jgi:hypothetical protein